MSRLLLFLAAAVAAPSASASAAPSAAAAPSASAAPSTASAALSTSAAPFAFASTSAAPSTSAAAVAVASSSPDLVKTPSTCAHANLSPSSINLPAIEAATLCLIDRLRRADHLHSLRFNADLHAVAAGQATEMVLGDYFGDDNRAGQTPLQRIVASSYPAHAARVSTAQNIGWGTGPDATPAAMMRAWLLSPPHRRIILTAGYRDIGIGVTPAVPASVTGGALGATYTVEFGVRQKQAPKRSSTTTGGPRHASTARTGLGGGTPW